MLHVCSYATAQECEEYQQGDGEPPWMELRRWLGGRMRKSSSCMCSCGFAQFFSLQCCGYSVYVRAAEQAYIPTYLTI